uniref:Uncharacterized protein n=1 Tax=Anguilla anguilla TaxID=7936 RepID=A0A0E9VCD1_ANGAN
MHIKLFNLLLLGVLESKVFSQ